MKRRFFQTLGLALIAVAGVSGQKESKQVRVIGTVYDQVGIVCPGTKIVAINMDGKQFETTADMDGNYAIELPVNSYKPGGDFRKGISTYTLKAFSTGFKVTEITGLKLVPPKMGVLNFDIVLEIGIWGDSQ